ncbi:MAG: hypothetical protein AAF989_03500 [Planctomycetota bacterium]
MRSRLYFLEGTGQARGDMDTIMGAIQTTVEPETWEALGGPSTMIPVSQSRFQRPALLVSAPQTVHHEIAEMLFALRETHFGDDPVLTETEIRRRNQAAMGFPGGGGGGGFM